MHDILKIKNLNKKFGGVIATKNLNLSILDGELHAIIGPNGAGKTTTMKMIIAEEHPTKGRIKIGPYEIESNDSKGFDYLGYCPQVFDLTQKTPDKNCDLNFFNLCHRKSLHTFC